MDFNPTSKETLSPGVGNGLSPLVKVVVSTPLARLYVDMSVGRILLGEGDDRRSTQKTSEMVLNGVGFAEKEKQNTVQTLSSKKQFYRIFERWDR